MIEVIGHVPKCLCAAVLYYCVKVGNKTFYALLSDILQVTTYDLAYFVLPVLICTSTSASTSTGYRNRKYFEVVY